MIHVCRYYIRWQSPKHRGWWFQQWKPTWHRGYVRYVSLGLWFLAVGAGDPRQYCINAAIKRKHEAKND